MLGGSSLIRRLIAWAFLTAFIMVALVGVVALTNYSKLQGGTCGSVGGEWTETTDQYICIVEKEEEASDH